MILSKWFSPYQAKAWKKLKFVLDAQLFCSWRCSPPSNLGAQNMFLDLFYSRWWHCVENSSLLQIRTTEMIICLEVYSN